MAKQKRIFIKEWLELKPYENQTKTDSYYLRIANKIYRQFSHPDSAILNMYLDEQDFTMLSCFLASYFEDVISEINIWRTFTGIHQKLYNKKLPFYDTNEYFDDEINLPDIAFLIWYFLNTVQSENFISPYNDFIPNIAEKVMSVLDEEYEFAPENDHLKSYYQLDKSETDFYKVRILIDTLLFKSWLFYPDTGLMLVEKELEIIEDDNDDENLVGYLQDARDSTLHSENTRLLSLKGKEWAAHILGEDHPLHTDLLNMSQRIRGFFFYKGQNENDIFLEHVASGKKFSMTQKSFDHAHLLNKVDIIMNIGIVKWQNEWWFSGVYFQNEFNADLVLEEKNSLESWKQVDFLSYNSKETQETLKKQFDAFLQFNKDSQIAFMPASEVESFAKDYSEYFNSTLNFTEKEKEDALKRTREAGYFGNKKKTNVGLDEKGDNALVFFNPKSGMEIALNFNDVLPFKNNPWYNPDAMESDILDLFISEETSKELSEFCIKHCRNKLKFFINGFGKLVLNDIDFLLRFWKRNNYYAKPSVTAIGKNKDS